MPKVHVVEVWAEPFGMGTLPVRRADLPKTIWALELPVGSRSAALDGTAHRSLRLHTWGEHLVAEGRQCAPCHGRHTCFQGVRDRGSLSRDPMPPVVELSVVLCDAVKARAEERACSPDFLGVYVMRRADNSRHHIGTQ